MDNVHSRYSLHLPVASSIQCLSCWNSVRECMPVKSKHDTLHLYVARPSRTMAGRHKQTLNCAEDPVATQTSSPVQMPENAAVPARMAGRPMSRCHKNTERNLAGSSPCLTRDNDLFTRVYRSGSMVFLQGALEYSFVTQ